MKSAQSKFLLSVIPCLMINVTSVLGDDLATISPQELDLTLGMNEVAREQVSLTINPLCVRPFMVDVVASHPDAEVTNITGALLNGCGGDTSTFEIEIIGTGEPQDFDLEFIDSEFGGVLASIPVTIDNHIMGLIIRRNAIVFQVPSSGCTTKGDFKVDVLESYPVQLRLIRLNDDPCDAYEPLGTRIRFTYRELGIHRGQQIRVVNPLATVEVPPRRR